MRFETADFYQPVIRRADAGQAVGRQAIASRGNHRLAARPAAANLSDLCVTEQRFFSVAHVEKRAKVRKIEVNPLPRKQLPRAQRNCRVVLLRRPASRQHSLVPPHTEDLGLSPSASLDRWGALRVS